MSEFFLKIFDTEGFPPRWQCGTGWTAEHGWLHIVSDSAIFGAYAAIPAALLLFMWRRRDVPFPGLVLLFAAFILFCGVGHLVEATIFWVPWYRFSALLKFGTAVVSWTTVLALVPLMPKLLSLPGVAAVNARLAEEIESRRRVEESMQAEIHRQEKLNKQLRQFSRLAVDRESMMIELKTEINELALANGQAARYTIPDGASDLSGMKEANEW